MRMFSDGLTVVKKMKPLLIMVAILYLLSYVAGWYLITLKIPLAVQIKQGIHNAVLTEEPFTFVLGFLQRGELLQAILATFAVNLTVGAFLTTTLPGTLPLVGALAIVAVTVFRGFTIGVTYPEVLAASPVTLVLGMGTLILELGAYVFSGAAGINIAVAPLFPQRYSTGSRITAFKRAWIDAARIFTIVAVLLILGAIWEMTGIFLISYG